MLHLTPSFGVRKQRVKSMKWVHNSLGLTSSMWRQVAWRWACLQSAGEEVKGSKLLENKKLSILTRTWICSVFILCFEDHWRDAPRLFCSYMKSAGTQYMTQTIAVYTSDEWTKILTCCILLHLLVWGNKELSPWSEFIICLVWLHQCEDKKREVGHAYSFQVKRSREVRCWKTRN